MDRKTRDAAILALLGGQEILVVRNKVWNVEETDWRDGNDEGQEWTVYTEPNEEDLRLGDDDTS